jgi:hypothetical protein
VTRKRWGADYESTDPRVREGEERARQVILGRIAPKAAQSVKDLDATTSRVNAVMEAAA